MRKAVRHKLLNGLLVVAMLFAPLQVSVSAIDMLDHGNKQSQHCQMQMDGQTQHEKSDAPDCCKNGFNCAKCVSVHAMMPELTNLSYLSHSSFEPDSQSIAHGIQRQGELRPPRTFS